MYIIYACVCVARLTRSQKKNIHLDCLECSSVNIFYISSHESWFGNREEASTMIACSENSGCKFVSTTCSSEEKKRNDDDDGEKRTNLSTWIRTYKVSKALGPRLAAFTAGGMFDDRNMHFIHTINQDYLYIELTANSRSVEAHQI